MKKAIDFNNNEVPKDIGCIADSMAQWEGKIAEFLGLTDTDVADIKTQHPSKLRLQT